jgi:hypothetical protein
VADIESVFRQFDSRTPELIHIDYPFFGRLRHRMDGSFKVFSDSWVLPLLSVPWLRMSGVDVIESNDPVIVARLL